MCWKHSSGSLHINKVAIFSPACFVFIGFLFPPHLKSSLCFRSGDNGGGHRLVNFVWGGTLFCWQQPWEDRPLQSWKGPKVCQGNIFPTVTLLMWGGSGSRFDAVYVNSDLIIEMLQQEVRCWQTFFQLVLCDFVGPEASVFVFFVPFRIKILFWDWIKSNSYFFLLITAFPTR